MGPKGGKSQAVRLFESEGTSTKEVSHDDFPDTYRVTIKGAGNRLEDDPGSGCDSAPSVDADELEKTKSRNQRKKISNGTVHPPVRFVQIHREGRS